MHSKNGFRTTGVRPGICISSRFSWAMLLLWLPQCEANARNGVIFRWQRLACAIYSDYLGFSSIDLNFEWLFLLAFFHPFPLPAALSIAEPGTNKCDGRVFMSCRLEHPALFILSGLSRCWVGLPHWAQSAILEQITLTWWPWQLFGLNSMATCRNMAMVTELLSQ